MKIVRRPSPIGELVSLRQAMDRLFGDGSVRPRPWGLSGDATNSSDRAASVGDTADTRQPAA